MVKIRGLENYKEVLTNLIPQISKSLNTTPFSVYSQIAIKVGSIVGFFFHLLKGGCIKIVHQFRASIISIEKVSFFQIQFGSTHYHCKGKREFEKENQQKCNQTAEIKTIECMQSQPFINQVNLKQENQQKVHQIAEANKFDPLYKVGINRYPDCPPKPKVTYTPSINQLGRK